MTLIAGAGWTATSNIGQYALAAIGLVLAWLIATVIYNIFFHPLRKFPGPLHQRALGLPWAIQLATGVQARRTQKLHDRYGPVVRVGPNHLTFTDARAWKDIYGHRVGNDIHTTEMAKSATFIRTLRSVPTSIISADREEHGRFRRALSHGFSDAAMRQQEPEIVKYIDLLIERLHEECDNGKKALNIEAWYNWTTFDIVGSLVFGQSFRCLENADYHPWIGFIFRSIKAGSITISMTYIGLNYLVQIMFKIAGSSIRKVRGYTDEMVRARLSMDGPRGDLFEGLVKRQKEWDLSFKKLSANAFVLVIAGSETTATTLAGATHLLLTHPDILEKLYHEVRSAFRDSSEININTVGNLKYMLAILNESLRMYPPVTSGLVRVVPKGGAEIAGHFVAEDTLVEIQQWSINHSKENWSEPWKFKPERFLGTSAEALDASNKLEALQAFSLGPRNCIGRNLAYAEMRIILARIIYDFDIKMADNSRDWVDRQKAFTLWDRIPLNVYLTPRGK